jgi:hypothetical protein
LLCECSTWNVPSPFSSLIAKSPSSVTNTVSNGRGSTSSTHTSMPFLQWPNNFEGAVRCSSSAKPCKAEDDGENCIMELARALEGLTGTTVQFISSTDPAGSFGAMATW